MERAASDETGSRLDKGLLWFIRLWIGFAILVNLAAVAGFMMAAPTVMEGLLAILRNIISDTFMNFLMEMILLSPAIGAYVWRESRKARR